MKITNNSCGLCPEARKFEIDIDNRAAEVWNVSEEYLYDALEQLRDLNVADAAHSINRMMHNAHLLPQMARVLREQADNMERLYQFYSDEETRLSA